jgi:hypothetical protein
MWVMNQVAVGGAALLVMLSLTGCSGWFGQDDVAEEPLRERIGDLASVVEVASAAESRVFDARVWVSVSELVESDLHAIVASADELLTGRDVTIKIALDEQVLLTIVFPHEFSAEELATEVDYWLALSNANQAPLGILLQTGGHGQSRNIWDPDKSDPVDWDALRAVPDPSTAYHDYFLDDMVLIAAIPPPDVLAFRDRLAAIELGDDESTVLEYAAPGYVMVRYYSPEAGRTDPTTSASWPQLQRVAEEVAALGLPQANIVVSTEDFDHGASVHLGDCDELGDGAENWASDELAAALASSGIEFPLGVSSGFCDDAHE